MTLALQSSICLEKVMVAHSCSAFLASRSNLRAAAPSKTGTLLIGNSYVFKLYGKDKKNFKNGKPING